MKIFENITWPEGAIYNITPKISKRMGGGADIEHISVNEEWSQQVIHVFDENGRLVEITTEDEKIKSTNENLPVSI